MSSFQSLSTLACIRRGLRGRRGSTLATPQLARAEEEAFRLGCGTGPAGIGAVVGA